MDKNKLICYIFENCRKEYERGDSNPQVIKTLDPKSSASTNSATLAFEITK